MADLVIKYERIATESAPPTPSRRTSKRTMSLVGSDESPRPPASTPAVVSHLPFTASNKRKRFLDSEEAGNATDAAEIEVYLFAMEKGQQRRFAEKYNYDVVNDVPLEGRYEWIPLSVGAVEETLK